MKISTKKALEEARKRWGSDAAIRDGGPKRASTEPAREAARKKRAELLETLTPAEKKARRRELDDLFSQSQRRRYDVGTVSQLPGIGPVFHIRGSGDSWDDAFKQADGRKA